MNPHAQKFRHTAVQRVTKQLEDLQTLVIALDDRLSELAKAMRAALEEQQCYVDARTDVSIDKQRAFVEMPFWARLRWLVVGAR